MQHISAKILNPGASGYEQKPSETLTQRKALRVWDRMQEMFGNTFTTQYGHVPLHTWSQAIGMMTDEQLLTGLKAVAMSGETFPPTLPKFIAMCEGKAAGEQAEYAPYHAMLPLDPPETEEHREARKARGREKMEEVKAALKS